MAAKPKTYYGTPCTYDCGGHRAGYNYARSGGSTPSPHSPSFNVGMGIASGTITPPSPRGRPRKR